MAAPPSLPRILKDAALRSFFRGFVSQNHDDALLNFYEATLDYAATAKVRGVRALGLAALHRLFWTLTSPCASLCRFFAHAARAR